MQSSTDTSIPLAETDTLEDYIKAGGNPDSSANQRTLGDLVQREVFLCMSSCVGAMIDTASEHGKFGDYSCEDFRDIQFTPVDYEQAAREEGWVPAQEALDEAYEAKDLPKLRAIFDDVCGGPEPDEDAEGDVDEEGYPEIDTMYERISDEMAFEYLKFSTLRSGQLYIETSDADDWEELVNELDLDDLNEHQREALEHWAVSGWLGERLSENGEAVGEFFGAHIWGRCTSGQSISMDGVMARIAAGMQILEGQKHDWSRDS